MEKANGRHNHCNPTLEASEKVKTCRNEGSSFYGGKQRTKLIPFIICRVLCDENPQHLGNGEQSSPYRAEVPQTAGVWTTHSGFMVVSEGVHLFPDFM